MEHFSRLDPILTWFSDKESHFNNEVMEFLAAAMGVKNLFSTAYAPWSNGTVEVVCKQLLRVMRAFVF